MSDEGDKQAKSGDSCINGSDIPEPFGFRCFVQDDVGLDKLLLDYNWYFLPWLSFVLWVVFLVVR